MNRELTGENTPLVGGTWQNLSEKGLLVVGKGCQIELQRTPPGLRRAFNGPAASDAQRDH